MSKPLQGHPVRPKSVAAAVYALNLGNSLSGEDLATLFECCPYTDWPAELRDYHLRFLRGEIRRKKGRKPAHPAAIDFDLGDSVDEYYEKLEQYAREDEDRSAAARSEGAKLPKAGDPPRVRAAQYVLDHNKERFRNISANGLINLFCKYDWLRRRGESDAAQRSD